MSGVCSVHGKAESYRRSGRRRLAAEVVGERSHDVGSAAAVRRSPPAGSRNAPESLTRTRSERSASSATSTSTLARRRRGRRARWRSRTPRRRRAAGARRAGSPTRALVEPTPHRGAEFAELLRPGRKDAVEAPALRPANRTARTTTSSSRDASTPSAATRRSQTWSSGTAPIDAPASCSRSEAAAETLATALDEPVRVEDEQGARLERRRLACGRERSSRPVSGADCAPSSRCVSPDAETRSIGGCPADA